MVRTRKTKKRTDADLPVEIENLIIQSLDRECPEVQEAKAVMFDTHGGFALNCKREHFRADAWGDVGFSYFHLIKWARKLRKRYEQADPELRRRRLRQEKIAALVDECGIKEVRAEIAAFGKMA